MPEGVYATAALSPSPAPKGLIRAASMCSRGGAPERRPAPVRSFAFREAAGQRVRPCGGVDAVAHPVMAGPHHVDCELDASSIAARPAAQRGYAPSSRRPTSAPCIPVRHVRHSAAASRRPTSGQVPRRPSGQRERSVKPPAQPTLVRTQHLPPARHTASDLQRQGLRPSRVDSPLVAASPRASPGDLARGWHAHQRRHLALRPELDAARSARGR